MKATLITTKKYFTTTLLEAQSIVKEITETNGSSVKKQSITKRQKSTAEEFIEYYIVDITIEKYTVKDLI